MVEQRGAAVVKVLHRLGFTNGPCLPCPVWAEVPPPLRGGWTLPRRGEECPDRAAWDVPPCTERFPPALTSEVTPSQLRGSSPRLPNGNAEPCRVHFPPT